MNRVKATASVAIGARDIAPVSGTPQFFTNGNPATPTPATVLPGYFLNMVQEELMAVILAAGLTADDTNWSQLLQAIQSLGRIKLTGNLTLFVSTTGSDANNGLAVGTPFATLQHAWNVLAAKYDLGGFSVTVQVAAGTYAAGVAASGVLTGGSSGVTANYAPVTFNLAAGANISVTNTQAFSTNEGAVIAVSGSGSVQASGASGTALFAASFSTILFSGISLGACGAAQIYAQSGGFVLAVGNYTVSGGAPSHAQVILTGTINIGAFLVTLTGTPAYSGAFASAGSCGAINLAGATFSGSATGSRYAVAANGVILTAGGGASFLPGNAVGTAATGGQYL